MANESKLELSAETLVRLLATAERERDEARQQVEAMQEALDQIAELGGDCEQQKFKLTRFQAAQIARAAILSSSHQPDVEPDSTPADEHERDPTSDQ